jgi:hypothetical protein
VTGQPEDVDPAFLEAGEGFHLVVGLGELDLRECRRGRCRGRLGHKPPVDSVGFYAFEDEAGSEGRVSGFLISWWKLPVGWTEPIGKSYSPFGK